MAVKGLFFKVLVPIAFFKFQMLYKKNLQLKMGLVLAILVLGKLIGWKQFSSKTFDEDDNRIEKKTKR